MPFCQPCSRTFTSVEALRQHISSSGSLHPSCTLCNKRFTSTIGYNAHMAAKHPPTFDCVKCERSFPAPFALEDHFRGSAAHPNCSLCGKGFVDGVAVEEHLRVDHDPANVVSVDEVDVSGDIAGENNAAFDVEPTPSALPEEDSRPVPSQVDFVMLSIPPSEAPQSPAMALNESFASPIREVAPPLPPPSQRVERVWSSRENIQVGPLVVPHVNIFSRPSLQLGLTSSPTRGLASLSRGRGEVEPTSPHTEADITSAISPHRPLPKAPSPESPTTTIGSRSSGEWSPLDGFRLKQDNMFFSYHAESPKRSSAKPAETTAAANYSMLSPTSPLASPVVRSPIRPLVTAVSHPLHCRICKMDKAIDIAATMCGHIFCYRCITDYVIQQPRCAVCASPTLLYCIFRLDLGL
ncbi:hypothetical protein BDN72DRAFT_828383 [Pluteus cervinus]|uniref:Uncharacterized protein n=1 Tax=Pluteus cervinus TaxID=181527 RepID=A0ACD3A6T8_9AGAR|nr:hypothetical protein BDN72DRAFT_828383 [Pluteus cervinus]